MRPRQESNLRTRLRRPALYPLSYGGTWEHPNYTRSVRRLREGIGYQLFGILAVGAG